MVHKVLGEFMALLLELLDTHRVLYQILCVCMMDDKSWRVTYNKKKGFRKQQQNDHNIRVRWKHRSDHLEPNACDPSLVARSSYESLHEYRV